MIPPSAANVISPGPPNSCWPLAMVLGFIGPGSVIGVAILAADKREAELTGDGLKLAIGISFTASSTFVIGALVTLVPPVTGPAKSSAFNSNNIP